MDGRYAIMDVKPGRSSIEAGAMNLNKIESLISKMNDDADRPSMRLPDLKVVITGFRGGPRRRRPVVPIGCLND